MPYLKVSCFRPIIIFLFLMFISSYYFANAFNALNNTVSQMCRSLRTLLPPLSMLMLIGAGVVYIGGQFTGAETRSRANVWATNLLIGALMGLLIAAVAPAALDILARVAMGQTSGNPLTGGAC